MKKSILVFLFLFCLQLPFITADPDTGISFSRDAFTDEGLYTSQVRNSLLTGKFQIGESDAAVKTPLFSLFMYLVFKIAGAKLLMARLAVLLTSLMVLFFVFRKELMLSVLMLLLTFTQYTVFHYTHFSMAEMLSVSSLVMGWYLMSLDANDTTRAKNNLLICLSVAMAMYFKFQFLYMLAWPLVFFSLILIYSLLMKDSMWKRYVSKFFIASGVLVLFLGIYYYAWYQPHKAIFDFVLTAQTTVVFGEGEWFRKMIDYNVEHFFMNSNARSFTFLFLGCLLLFPYLVWHFRANRKIIFQLTAAFSWCLLELHKPALAYLPGRYLVSTFFSMGLFSSVVLFRIHQLIPKPVYKWSVVALMVLWPCVQNASAFMTAYKQRSELLSTINEFVKEHAIPGRIIAGPWAPSVSWESQSPSIPVWKDYFNDKNTMENLHPCIIISELDEEDSGGAWKTQGIDLNAISTTTTDFRIHDWKVRVYVLKQ